MNLAAVEQIARAVLYEGYMLYPYRPSSVKNKQRWNFGVLSPEAYSALQGGTDPCFSQTECLVYASPNCAIEVRIRFLHLIARTLGRLMRPQADGESVKEPEFELVERLQVAGQVLQPWEEAEEREVVLCLTGQELLASTIHPFNFEGVKRLEQVRDETGIVSGLIIRKSETVCGRVEISTEQSTSVNVFKLTIRICNITPLEQAEQKTRDEALKSSLLSAHVVLGVTGGEFVSLLEPPEHLREIALNCRNIGTWPVLVGEAGQRDTLLSSPIILYDYPQIAPESAGDLFDGTEIDEILSLRIMTLTEDEKREMRESDVRAREILERTEALPPEQLMKLHGVVRSLNPLEDEEAS